MKEQDMRFLRSVSAEYYTTQADLVYVPPPVNKREIGFTVGHEKVMVRHMAFDTIDDIKAHLRDNLPWDAYHSCAVYEFPDKPIDQKKELWIELAFDIDPDPTDPRCGKRNSYWICVANDHYGTEKTDKCVYCGGSIKKIDFIDPVCLNMAAKETIRLVGALVNELNIGNEDLRIYFSGNKGFHIYARSDLLKDLDQNGRKEIVDYLALNGLKEDLIITRAPGKRRILTEGVGGRIIQNAIEIIERCREYPNIFSNEAMNRVEREKERLRQELNKGLLDPIFLMLGTSKAKKFLAMAVESSKIRVDPSVTLDLHRLFRMPGTISSKSHLPKFPVELKTLANNVLDAMPEYGPDRADIHVKIAPEIRMSGRKFGPYENEKVEVPGYLAAYLVTKGVATIV